MRGDNSVADATVSIDGMFLVMLNVLAVAFGCFFLLNALRLAIWIQVGRKGLKPRDQTGDQIAESVVGMLKWLFFCVLMVVARLSV